MTGLDDLLKPQPGAMQVQPVSEQMFTEFGFDVSVMPGAGGAVAGYKLTMVDKAGYLYSFVFDPIGFANFKAKLPGLTSNGGG